MAGVWKTEWFSLLRRYTQDKLKINIKYKSKKKKIY